MNLNTARKFPNRRSSRRRLWRLLSLFSVLTLAAPVAAEQTWMQALAGMPLVVPTIELNRTNCVGLMLRSFRSNDVVKALIFMPGATDEFYMFRRAQARLSQRSPSLLDALGALTNQTLIRATFRAPMLLLHTDEDPLAPEIAVLDASAPARLKNHRFPHLLFDDRDWGVVQPALKWALKAQIRPWHDSQDAWHFYRHSFAAWNLNGWEALEATALAGKSKFTVNTKQVVFEPDARVLALPRFEPGSQGSGGWR